MNSLQSSLHAKANQDVTKSQLYTLLLLEKNNANSVTLPIMHSLPLTQPQLLTLNHDITHLFSQSTEVLY